MYIWRTMLGCAHKSGLMAGALLPTLIAEEGRRGAADPGRLLSGERDSEREAGLAA